jgi:transcription elongation factor Elf1
MGKRKSAAKPPPKKASTTNSSPACAVCCTAAANTSAVSADAAAAAAAALSHAAASSAPLSSLSQAAPKLEEQFNCPFCNSAKSVSCQMDWETSRGTVTCGACHESYSAPIHQLSEAIDVYHDWLDACELHNT